MWPDHDTTQRLLVDVGEGDDAAVNELIERHRGAIRRMVAARMDRGMAGRVDASDIVQEALIEVHRRLADYLNDGTMPDAVLTSRRKVSMPSMVSACHDSG